MARNILETNAYIGSDYFNNYKFRFGTVSQKSWRSISYSRPKVPRSGNDKEKHTDAIREPKKIGQKIKGG